MYARKWAESQALDRVRELQEPPFRIRTLVFTGEFTLAEGIEQVLPGEEAVVINELIAPAAPGTGNTRAFMEREQVIGTGVVIGIIHQYHAQTATRIRSWPATPSRLPATVSALMDLVRAR